MFADPKREFILRHVFLAVYETVSRQLERLKAVIKDDAVNDLRHNIDISSNTGYTAMYNPLDTAQSRSLVQCVGINTVQVTIFFSFLFLDREAYVDPAQEKCPITDQIKSACKRLKIWPINSVSSASSVLMLAIQGKLMNMVLVLCFNPTKIFTMHTASMVGYIYQSSCVSNSQFIICFNLSLKVFFMTCDLQHLQFISDSSFLNKLF